MKTYPKVEFEKEEREHLLEALDALQTLYQHTKKGDDLVFLTVTDWDIIADIEDVISLLKPHIT